MSRLLVVRKRWPASMVTLHHASGELGRPAYPGTFPLVRSTLPLACGDRAKTHLYWHELVHRTTELCGCTGAPQERGHVFEDGVPVGVRATIVVRRSACISSPHQQGQVVAGRSPARRTVGVDHDAGWQSSTASSSAKGADHRSSTATRWWLPSTCTSMPSRGIRCRRTRCRGSYGGADLFQAGSSPSV